MKSPLMAMMLCYNDPEDAVPGDSSTVRGSETRPRYPQISMKNGGIQNHNFIIIIITVKKRVT